jgi:hypothetical protein
MGTYISLRVSLSCLFKFKRLKTGIGDPDHLRPKLAWNFQNGMPGKVFLMFEFVNTYNGRCLNKIYGKVLY